MRKYLYVGKSTFQSDHVGASRAFSSHAGKRRTILSFSRRHTPSRREIQTRVQSAARRL